MDDHLGAQLPDIKHNLSLAPMSAIRNDVELERVSYEIEQIHSISVLHIAARVSLIHDYFKYKRDEGGFRGHMKRRLRCCKSKAYDLLNVHKRFGTGESVPFLDTLPREALYLLAKPSTPDAAKDKVVTDLKAGNRPDLAAVKKIVASEQRALKLTGTGKKSDEESDEGSESSTSNKFEAEDSDQALQHDEGDHGRRGTDGNGHADKSAKHERDHAGAHHDDHDDHADANDVRDADEAQVMRDLVLEEYFARATGSDICHRMTKARGAVAHAEYLDAVTVPGMLEVASDEFRRQLCAKLPGKSKKFKTMNAVQTGRDASGKPIFTPQGRAGHSHAN